MKFYSEIVKKFYDSAAECEAAEKEAEAAARKEKEAAEQAQKRREAMEGYLEDLFEQRDCISEEISRKIIEYNKEFGSYRKIQKDEHEISLYDFLNWLF